MAKGDGTLSITYYIGVSNILLTALWGVLFASGWLGTETGLLDSSALPFYVGTLFILGIGLLFPSIEKGWQNRTKINTGLVFSIMAVLVYGTYIAAFYRYRRLNFFERDLQEFFERIF